MEDTTSFDYYFEIDKMKSLADQKQNQLLDDDRDKLKNVAKGLVDLDAGPTPLTYDTLKSITKILEVRVEDVELKSKGITDDPNAVPQLIEDLSGQLYSSRQSLFTDGVS